MFSFLLKGFSEQEPKNCTINGQPGLIFIKIFNREKLQVLLTFEKLVTVEKFYCMQKKKFDLNDTIV